MRPLYRTWFEFSAWLVGIVLWLWLLQTEACLWQPLILWVTFMVLFILTKKLGYAAGALPFVAILVLIGWIFLARLDPRWATQQFWGALLGALAFLIGLFLRPMALDVPLLWAGGALGLVAITAVFGQSIGGAKAWISVAGLRFQPVEIARISLIFYLGHHLNEHRSRREMLLVLATFFGILAWQRDLGPALLVFLVYCLMSLSKDFSWSKVFIYVGTAVLGFFVALSCFPHLKSRALAWIYPWDYLDSKGYQVLQGLFALSAGGLVGQGLGKGLVHVIPEGHTDYLFAIIGEELGLIGTFSLMVIYVALAFWALRLLARVEDEGQQMIGLGLTLLLHGQVFLVVGGILRLLPFTGMTLPFVSYGSTSLVAQFLMLGMLTSLGREPS